MPLHAVLPSRLLASSLAALTAAAVLVPATTAAAADPVPPVASSTAPDPLAPYTGQVSCDPTAKPGARAVAALVVAAWRPGSRTGIDRSCSTGGTSEHKEGRAVDWMLDVADQGERETAERFIAWATGPDAQGVTAGNARRLGIQYLIWNRRTWQAWRSDDAVGSGWKDYTGASPHTDHVHISLSWDGAMQRTSWWTGRAITRHDLGPCRVYVGEPVPPYSGPRYGACPAPVDRYPVERFVGSVYRDLFGRAPDADGLRHWSAQLRGGSPRSAVAAAITSSTEFRSRAVQAAYRRYLGRSVDPGGLATWVGELGRGATVQRIEAGLLGSQERWQQAGGDRGRWVRRLYRDVLGRDAAPAEVEHWAAQLRAGTSREDVAHGFLVSAEHLTSVVDGFYRQLLGRGLDASGRSTWVGAIQSGRRDSEVVGSLVASEEYLRRATS